jgi:hypothetical protein
MGILCSSLVLNSSCCPHLFVRNAVPGQIHQKFRSILCEPHTIKTGIIDFSMPQVFVVCDVHNKGLNLRKPFFCTRMHDKNACPLFPFMPWYLTRRTVLSLALICPGPFFFSVLILFLCKLGHTLSLIV